MRERTLVLSQPRATRVPANVAECWLANGHVRRALRAAGVEEDYLTGSGADFEKLATLLEALPSLQGSPLYDAVTTELQALGCTLLPNGENAAAIWQETAALLAARAQRPADYLEAADVDAALVATSPLDFDKNTFYPLNGMKKCQIRPLFSPDDVLTVTRRDFAEGIRALGARVEVKICDLHTLCEALERMLDDFAAAGCKEALHSTLVQEGYCRPDPYHAGEILHRALTEKKPAFSPCEIALFHAQMMRFLGIAYAKRGMRLYLLPPIGTMASNLSGVAKYDKINTVSGLNPENGFCELLFYLLECGGLPETVIGLSPATPYGILRRISGHFPPLDGKPRVLWGIDGEWCTAADIAAIAQAICRESAADTFVGVLRDAEGFLTAPVTRMLRSVL